MSSVPDEEEWALAPENAHPNARALMAEPFFWDCVDEDAPFGNDTAADVLVFFRDWRQANPTASPLAFLGELLGSWEIADEHWDVATPEEVAELLKMDEAGQTTRDDAALALALAQLALEGSVDAEVRQRALLAARRQSVAHLITKRGGASALMRWSELLAVEAAGQALEADGRAMAS
jgi:uncharacterized protein YfeS